ncbi:hypothetical protein DFH11DRAFT_1598577 [Phellopilus nigrolimitatus]|nr:hypothetical protein DFH11DRAFT_1598577 [Phellopilus nigrolimitatus]
MDASSFFCCSLLCHLFPGPHVLIIKSAVSHVSLLLICSFWHITPAYTHLLNNLRHTTLSQVARVSRQYRY